MPTVRESPLWLRLGEAADYLGVHSVTLRRWADEAKVACIRTPGGRRRFIQADLDDFLASSRHEAATSAPHAIALHPFSPMQLTAGHMNLRDQAWYGQMNERQLAGLRGHGQKLMATLMYYISRDEGGEPYLQEGERLAVDYAGLFLNHGLSLTDVIHGFLKVRRSITDALHEAQHTEDRMDETAYQLHSRTEDFFDRVLIAMVNVYEDASS
jgi:excisionase family DNA binding protein